MCHPLSRRAVLGATVLCLGLLTTPGRAAPDPNDDSKVFVGYVFGRPRGLNYRLYTHLCHAFLTADGDGRVTLPRGIAGRELTGEAHKSGVKVLLSLGGWGWDKQFAAIVSRPEAEDRYVSAVMDAVAAADYDGIDLDWEYPDTEREVAGFERLVRRFRTRLDERGRLVGRRMLVTMAASSNPGTLKWLGKDFLLETMDWVNVMTYDYRGPWMDHAGHHAPLFASSKPRGAPRSVERSLAYLLDDRGLPANRLAVGIPLYGVGFAVSKPYSSTKGIAKARVPGGDYRNLQTLEREKGWEREWDNETRTPWLIAPDGSAVIGYDDAESVAFKTEWTLRKGLRGVFFWQVGGDRLADGSNPLQDASRKAFDAAAKPAKP
jgi:chitinase